MIRRNRRAHPGLRFLLAVGLLAAIVLLGVLKHQVHNKRAPGQSLARRALTPLESEQVACRHVHEAKDECAFIRQHCDDEDSGLFSYLELYYCEFPQLKPLAFFIIIIWAALLFTTIGVAASEFFSINLSTIAALLRLSENVAGVTFLAFGNGSADVFSTFAAMKSNSGSLAVGELIGAAGFISAVVPGTMALIRPFKTGKSGFMRDVSLLAVAVSFSMVFLVNGRLEWWECVVMIVFYIFYATMVVVWHWWKERRRRRRERMGLARAHFGGIGPDEVEALEEYRDEDSGDERTFTYGVSTNDLHALETSNLDDSEEDDTRVTPLERERWLGELSRNMRVTKPPAGDIGDITTPIRPSLIGALEFQALLASLQKARHTRSINLRRYSDDPTFTALQQQLTNSDDHDPRLEGNQQGVLQNYGLQNGGPNTTLEARANMTRHNRAVSTSDAPTLRTDPRALRPQTGQRSRVRSRTISSTSNLQVPGAGPTQGGRQSAAIVSPLITISEPDTEFETDFSSLPPAQMSDHLQQGDALPSPSHNHTSSSHLAEQTPTGSATALTSQRPRLKITPPATPPRSRRSSPRPHLRSPLALFADDERLRDLGVPSNLYLGQPVLGPMEPLVPIDSRDGPVPPSKPLRWWPYGILPAPSTMVRTLFPTLYMWSEKTAMQKLLGIVSTPSLFLLTITLPVVQRQDSERPVDEDSPQSGRDTKYQDDPTLEVPSSALQPRKHATELVQPSEQPGMSSPIDATASSAGIAAAALESRHPHQTELLTSHPQEWNRWLTIVHCFTAPWFVVLVVWANVALPDTWILLKATMISVLGSLVVLAAVLLTSTPSRPPRWRPVLSFVGFFVAVAWISTIADEVVGVLKSIGVICNISDAILGLTIFAVGNSLGDLVADITVARLGHPVMALSACFGGPMLNILLGIGLSGLYVTIHGAQKRQHKHPDRPWKFKPFHIDISTTLLISAGSLLLTLLALLVIVPLNKWRIDRRVGIGLICLWVFATVANVAVELTGYADLVNR